MNALVAGSGSYIVRLSVRDLHGPTDRMLHCTVDIKNDPIRKITWSFAVNVCKVFNMAPYVLV